MTTTTRVFLVEGMHCGSCALLIDDALADLPGVRSSETRMKDGRSTVELDLSRCSEEDVIMAITELGYRATPLP